MQTIEERIQRERNFYDFKQGISMLSFNDEYEKIRTSLSKANLHIPKRYLHYQAANWKKDTMAFYGDFFTLYDVIYLPGDNYVPLTYAGRENADNKIKNLLEGIDKYCNLVSPFDIPVIQKEASPFYGELARRIFNYQDEPLVKMIPVIFTEITLGIPYTHITPPVYAHEITHTQVFRNKGVMDYPDYMEVLSIFMEKLCSYYENILTFREIERRRCQSLLSSLTRLKNNIATYDDQVYITSTLIAERLFNNYIEASYNDQIRIIESIQAVFDGHMPIGTMLESYNINPNECQNTQSIESNLRL